MLVPAVGPSLQVIADGPGNPSKADDWHTDVTWTAEPPDMAFLQALVMPARGGVLDRHIDDPRFHVRRRWTPGDLAIWDERSTNHRAVGDSGELERVIRRIEIDGTRPYFDPAA